MCSVLFRNCIHNTRTLHSKHWVKPYTQHSKRYTARCCACWELWVPHTPTHKRQVGAVYFTASKRIPHNDGHSPCAALPLAGGARQPLRPFRSEASTLGLFSMSNRGSLSHEASEAR